MSKTIYYKSEIMGKAYEALTREVANIAFLKDERTADQKLAEIKGMTMLVTDLAMLLEDEDE